MIIKISPDDDEVKQAKYKWFNSLLWVHYDYIREKIDDLFVNKTKNEIDSKVLPLISEEVKNNQIEETKNWKHLIKYEDTFKKHDIREISMKQSYYGQQLRKLNKKIMDRYQIWIINNSKKEEK